MESNGYDVAKNTTEATKKAATALATQVNKVACRAGDAVGDAAEIVAKGVSDNTDNLVALASDLAEQGVGIAKDQLATLKSQSAKFTRAAEEKIKKNPLLVVAVATAVAIVVAGATGFIVRGNRA